MLSLFSRLSLGLLDLTAKAQHILVVVSSYLANVIYERTCFASLE
jgi:hypothetical protein